MSALNELSATDTVGQIRAGEITAEAVMRDCLQRVSEREKTIKAWAYLNEDQALESARLVDNNEQKGPLAGLPVGIKDVLDTADMPTQMGSPIYRGWQPMVDSATVSLMRNAGAVIMGKTVTCEFAGSHPSPTRNPRNPDHTPGGSSSGSAAAVADKMVHIAFGTQTGGSVLRPASFCGIFGYKPTYNIINRSGLLFASENLDTIGLMARTIEDIDLVSSVMLNRDLIKKPRDESQPRIGLVQTHLWAEAKSETRFAVEDAARRLSDAGAEIVEIRMPDSFQDHSNIRNLLNDFERSRVLAWHVSKHRNKMSDPILEQIDHGLKISWDQYRSALERAEAGRTVMDTIFKPLDFILTPSASGEAPQTLADTGDARFQGYWTILHVPTITLPTHVGPKNLPVGIQLVCPRWQDNRLISWCKWVTQILIG
jgi:Asp-tRNA(Asn)/Glu-tRNA(Gln) amidotransferase A subunit family amidase